MRVRYSKDFIKVYKKAEVRIRSRVDQRIALFEKNTLELGLRDHPLRGSYQGYRSRDITSDWRAIYKVIEEKDNPYAYFIALGTHSQLYKS